MKQDPVHGRPFLAQLNLPELQRRRGPPPPAPFLATVPVPPYDFARTLRTVPAPAV